jgi:GTP-binding protein Era
MPAILAVNKIDRLDDKAELLPIMEAFDALDRYAEIMPISAKNGAGVDALVAAIAKRLPEGPKLFPEDMYTDRAERFLAGELVREQLFRQLGQELPYASAVVVESFRERAAKGDIVIEAIVYVERESQKGMVVGKGGHRIKTVGERSRKAISQLFGCPVHVKLRVKVSADWSRGDRGIRDMGYE